MNKETLRRRQVCAGCAYPLLRLDGFEGTSSHAAPDFGARCDHNDTALLGFFWDLAVLPWHWLTQVARGGRHRVRIQAVARLRADILPQAPDAMICPRCLRVALPEDFA